MIERRPPRVWLPRKQERDLKVDQTSADQMSPGIAPGWGKRLNNQVGRDILDS